MNKDKVAILTAAGTGMGADAAKKLVSDGLKFLFYHLLAKEKRWQKNLAGLGSQVLISQMKI